MRTRRNTRVVASLALVTALVGGARADAFAATAASAAPFGGGYVVTPQSFRSAGVTVDVPTIRCTSTTTRRSLVLGIFGATHVGGTSTPWFVRVRVFCSGGRTHYAGEFGTDRVEGTMPVHRADRVRLSADGGHGFTVDDQTTGAGMGGDSSAVPGQVTDRTVLVGARVTGTVPAKIQELLYAVRVNGGWLGNTPHHKQIQVRGGATVVAVGSIQNDRRFAVTVS
jgi:hypothetical protein